MTPTLSRPMPRSRALRFSPLALVALAGLNPAWAEVPAVLDRVPTDTPIVVAVANVEASMKRVEAMSKTLGKAAADQLAAGLWQMNSMLNMPGVNKAGSMALVMGLPEKGAKPTKDADAMDDGDAPARKEPPGVVLVPVSDYPLFIKTFKGDPADKVAQVEIDGKPVFVKSLDAGYAVMGGERALVEKFDGKSGRKADHLRLMGKVGSRIADSTDILLLANMPLVAPALEDGMKEMKNNPMLAMAQAQGAGDGLKTIEHALDALMRDAQVAVVGLGMGDKGLTLDFGAQFKDGTSTAKMFKSKGDSGALMTKLPAGDFLFAGAFDLSAPEMKQMIRDAAKTAPGAEPDPMSTMANLARSIDSLDGQAIYMGATELGSGLMTRAVIFSKTKDPQAYIASARESSKKMNGAEANGIKFETSFAPADEASGIKGDKWSMKLVTDPNNPAGPQIEMMMGFVYGSEGRMAGYVVPAEGGVVTTMSENSKLLKAALDSAKSGVGLAQDAMFKDAQSLLLPDRTAEFYIGTKSLMDTIGGAMALWGGPEIVGPDKASPIALGAISDAGGMGFRLALPNDVLKAIADTAKGLQGAANDMADPEAKPDKKNKGPGF